MLFIGQLGIQKRWHSQSPTIHQPTYPTFVLGFPSVAFKCIYVGQIVYQGVHLLNPTVAHCICIFINCQCIYQIKGFIFQPYLGYLRHEKMMIIIIFIIYKLSLYLYLKLQICIFRCTVWTRESVWNTEYMGWPSATPPHELCLCPAWILKTQSDPKTKRRSKSWLLPPFFFFS